MTKLHWVESDQGPIEGFGRRFLGSLIWVVLAAGIGLIAVGRLLVRDASAALERNPLLVLELLRQPVAMGVCAAIVAMLAAKAAVDEWEAMADRKADAAATAAAWTPDTIDPATAAAPSTVAARARRITVGSVLQGLLFVGLAVGIVVFRPLAWGGVTSYAVVVGISMEPTMHTGDLAIVMRQDAYAIGDIVSYHPSAAPDGEIMHRIVAGDASGWVTQGDNRRDPDPDRSTSANIVGKVVVHLPYAGFVVNSLRNPYVLGTIVAVLVMAVAWDLVAKRSRAAGR